MVFQSVKLERLRLDGVRIPYPNLKRSFADDLGIVLRGNGRFPRSGSVLIALIGYRTLFLNLPLLNGAIGWSVLVGF